MLSFSSCLSPPPAVPTSAPPSSPTPQPDTHVSLSHLTMSQGLEVELTDSQDLRQSDGERVEGTRCLEDRERGVKVASLHSSCSYLGCCQSLVPMSISCDRSTTCMSVQRWCVCVRVRVRVRACDLSGGRHESYSEPAHLCVVHPYLWVRVIQHCLKEVRVSRGFRGVT